MLHEKDIDLYAYFNVPRPENAKGYLSTYVLEKYSEFATKKIRPAMLVIPGGGYWMCSERECQPIALSYLAQGFQTFSLIYTTGDDAHFPTMLIEAAMAVAYIKINAKKYGIDPEKVAVCGFSAGGHLAASISTMYADEPVLSALKENALYAKPSASVLCYPVITFVDATHQGTRERATAKDASKDAILSPELRVNKDTPIAFIWTTSEDICVPPISSLLYATAMTKNGIPFELHVYQKGPHGLALGTEETSLNPATDNNLNLDAIEWVDKSVKFLKRNGFVCYNEE